MQPRFTYAHTEFVMIQTRRSSDRHPGAAAHRACCAAALLALGCASPPKPEALASSASSALQSARDLDPVVARARAFRSANGARILDGFRELLALPNVARDLDDVRRNAEWIRAHLAARGVDAVLWESDDAPPVVFGRLAAPGATRTLGIYVHYDGQPVTPANWSTPPFEPTLFTREPGLGGVPRAWPQQGEPIDPEWRIYARSAGDDKAPIPALLAALDLLDAGERTSNLVFLFEGEEEAGSGHLGTYLAEHGAELDVDAWLICDGPVHATRRPQLVFGVRGVTGMELTVYGATRSLHSGHYGNWAPNPAMLLAQLLATMRDDDGNVLVEGYYDSVQALGPAERAAIAALPVNDVELKRELGLARTEGPRTGGLLAERILLPSLNICGLSSARVGAESRNVIPSEATATLDLRLVLGNEPDAMVDLVEAHIRRQGFHIVRDAPDEATRLEHERIVRVDRTGGYPAARTPIDAPIGRLLRSAVARANDAPVVLTPGLGGSLPLYLFQREDTPVVVVPIANHDNNQHAPNENLRIANLWYGIDLFAAILTSP